MTQSSNYTSKKLDSLISDTLAIRASKLLGRINSKHVYHGLITAIATRNYSYLNRKHYLQNYDRIITGLERGVIL